MENPNTKSKLKSKPKVEEVLNPRRILLVGTWDCPLLELLEDITGSQPILTGTEDTLAGTSHILPLETAYYTTKVPIWVDILPAPPVVDDESSNIAKAPSPPPSWSEPYLLPEAKPVLSALGAFVVCFRKPASEEEFEGLKGVLGEVGRVRDACEGGWDGVCLAVGVRRGRVGGWSVVGGDDGGEDEGEKTTEVEIWEDVCADFGFEFVDGEVKDRDGKKRNAFGELTGLPRLIQALQSNDWNSTDVDPDPDLEFEFDLDADMFARSKEGERDDSLGVLLSNQSGFAVEAAELQGEFLGLKGVVGGDGEGQEGEEGDEENDVERLEALMLRMQAVKDQSIDMSPTERKRFAARAVRDVMRSF